MRFRCFNGICVCLRKATETETPGGIILPDVAQKKSEEVTILETCPRWVENGVTLTSELKPGDRALISKYSGEEYEIKLATGQKLKVVLVKEKDIRCVIDDDDDEPVAAVNGVAPVAESEVWVPNLAAAI